MSEPGRDWDRREIITRIGQLGAATAATGALGLWLRGRSRKPEDAETALVHGGHLVADDPAFPHLVIVQGEDPRMLVRRAVEEIGGIRRFISRGDVVVVKPNMSWDRTPEQAANTNPDLVAEVVRLCLEAGPARVIVTDISTHEPRRVYQRSGIAAAASAAGAVVLFPEDRKFKEVDLKGEILTTWPVFEPFLSADKVINVPIAKQHSLTGATLGMKNWYGILGGQRHRLHQRIHESLADLAGFMRPTLTIMDAYRILARNGPTGGDLADVELKKTLIAGTDPVAVDAYTARAFWNIAPERMTYLRMAKSRGLGEIDLEKVPTRVIAA